MKIIRIDKTDGTESEPYELTDEVLTNLMGSLGLEGIENRASIRTALERGEQVQTCFAIYRTSEN